jgi:hypothetical protein
MAKDAVILISGEHPSQMRRVERNGGNPDLTNNLERFENGQKMFELVFPREEDGTARRRMDLVSGAAGG